MGVPDGEFYLGECYEAGWGTEPAWNKAVHHYERAYSLGNPAAAMRLANGYLRDTGDEESEAKAMEWLRLADEKGNGEASYRLGKVYASRGKRKRHGQLSAGPASEIIRPEYLQQDFCR